MLFLFSSFACGRVRNGFLVTKRRCRAQGSARDCVPRKRPRVSGRIHDHDIGAYSVREHSEAHSFFPPKRTRLRVRNSLANQIVSSVCLPLFACAFQGARFTKADICFLHWRVFSDKKALSRTGEREGLRPSQKTPRQRACVSTLSVREQSEAHSFFPPKRTRLRVRNPLANQIVSSVYVSVRLRFLAHAFFILLILQLLSIRFPTHDLTPLPQDLVQPPNTHLRYRPQ